jgi:hypothetical protein
LALRRLLATLLSRLAMDPVVLLTTDLLGPQPIVLKQSKYYFKSQSYKTLNIYE